MTAKNDKSRSRQAALAARKEAHARTDPSTAVRNLFSHIRCIPALEVISGYMPIRTEIDPMPALQRLADAGYTLCLPVVAGAGCPLTFRRWAPGDQLVPGAYGAAIPEREDLVEPELLVTPLLAFDREGYRLGYGGGFYDRTLEALRAKRRTYAVGFAYQAQLVGRVPREVTDQPLDAVVTEEQTYLTA